MKRKYSAILGNLGNTSDRFCSGYKDNKATEIMLKEAVSINGVTGIELVGTWDIRPNNVKEMRKSFEDLGIKCVSIIPDLFTDKIYAKGAFSNPDPKIRRQAINYTRQMCDIAIDMDCNLMNIWPGQDGYDYMLTVDYEKERDLLCKAVQELAESYPDIKFALEYKPKEPRTHSYLARMADTLLLVKESMCDNVGVTIDTGHAFVGGENVSEAIVMAKRAGDKLFHIHFNDNYTSWDDDMIVGTIHSICYIEMLYWLNRCEYDGWLSMDQYPYREDAAGAIGESIEWLKGFDIILKERHKEMDKLISSGNAVETSKFLRNVLIK